MQQYRMELYGPQLGQMIVLPSQGVVVLSQPGLLHTILAGPSNTLNLWTQNCLGTVADDGVGIECG